MSAHALLGQLVSRIENIDGEMAEIRRDRADVFAEAKAHGFDLKALREVIRRRKMKPHHRAELDELVGIYEGAVGHGLSRGEIDGGELTALAPPAVALPAPAAKMSAKQREMAEALAWAGVGACEG